MFRFTPSTILKNIIVVGCGGTGSRLVPMLTQFIGQMTRGRSPRGYLEDPTIFLCDFDVVEAKNLARQNFVSNDVGKNKAAVLAARYGKAYDVKVVAYPHKLDASSTSAQRFLEESSIVKSTMPQTMLIMCVDSAQARRDVLKFFRNTGATNNPLLVPFIIDAGNEDNFGQVRCFSGLTGSSSHVATDFPDKSPIIVDITAIPMDTQYYETLTEGEVQLSCADLDQTLAINAIMSTYIMAFVQNYYYRQPFMFNQWSISLNGGASTQFLTPKSVYEVCRKTSENPTPAYSYSQTNFSSAIFSFLNQTSEFLAEQRLASERAQQLAKAKAEEARKKAEEAQEKAVVSEVATKPKKRKSKLTEIEEVVSAISIAEESVSYSEVSYASPAPAVPTFTVEQTSQVVANPENSSPL